MDDLKTMLFERTYKTFNNLLHRRERLGAAHPATERKNVEYTALFSFLVSAGLAEEYQQWKQQQQQQ